MLSLIIPALNEAQGIPATLAAANRIRGCVETIVVDGGSTDATVEIARRMGARVLRSERGRGRQMHAGACAARGEALWFLHADTLPPADAAEKILEALGDRRVAGGRFTVRFDGDGRAARFLTWLKPKQEKLGLLYGDSAIFVRWRDYFAAGGFAPFPIFEDLDFLRRLERRGRLVRLASEVVTSSRRFEGRFAATFARWTLMQALYWLGIHPRRLGRLYPLRPAASLAPGREGRPGAS